MTIRDRLFWESEARKIGLLPHLEICRRCGTDVCFCQKPRKEGMMTKITEAFSLLPCPFCGHRAILEEVESKSVGISAWTVGCVEQDGEIECMGYQSLTTFSRKIEAVKAWNTRDGKLVTVIEQPPQLEGEKP